MLDINVENFTRLAVVECKGRIVHSDAVFKLRDAVQAQEEARVIAIDLSEVPAIGGGGIGMLAFLGRWAAERGIRLKLFCPSRPVMEEINKTGSRERFDVASFQEMMGLVARFDHHEFDPHEFDRLNHFSAVA